MISSAKKIISHNSYFHSHPVRCVTKPYSHVLSLELLNTFKTEHHNHEFLYLIFSLILSLLRGKGNIQQQMMFLQKRSHQTKKNTQNLQIYSKNNPSKLKCVFSCCSLNLLPFKVHMRADITRCHHVNESKLAC